MPLPVVDSKRLTFASISKTMGESFKHHSQALIGYVDEIDMEAVASMPPVADQNLISMEAAY